MCDKFICKLYIQKSKNVLLRSVENVFNQMYKYLARVHFRKIENKIYEYII